MRSHSCRSSPSRFTTFVSWRRDNKRSGPINQGRLEQQKAECLLFGDRTIDGALAARTVTGLVKLAFVIRLNPGESKAGPELLILL